VDLPASQLDLDGQRRGVGYDVFLPQVRGHARDRLDQLVNADRGEELVVEVQPQFLIVRCRPARRAGVSEPGDDPSQLRQRTAFRLGLTADEDLERRPARLAMLPGDGNLGSALRIRRPS